MLLVQKFKTTLGLCEYSHHRKKAANSKERGGAPTGSEEPESIDYLSRSIYYTLFHRCEDRSSPIRLIDSEFRTEAHTMIMSSNLRSWVSQSHPKSNQKARTERDLFRWGLAGSHRSSPPTALCKLRAEQAVHTITWKPGVTKTKKEDRSRFPQLT